MCAVTMEREDTCKKASRLTKIVDCNESFGFTSHFWCLMSTIDSGQFGRQNT